MVVVGVVGSVVVWGAWGAGAVGHLVSSAVVMVGGALNVVERAAWGARRGGGSTVDAAGDLGVGLGVHCDGHGRRVSGGKWTRVLSLGGEGLIALVVVLEFGRETGKKGGEMG